MRLTKICIATLVALSVSVTSISASCLGNRFEVPEDAQVQASFNILSGDYITDGSTNVNPDFITLRVIDESTNLPVINARVKILNNEGREFGYTNSEGYANINVLSDFQENLELLVEAPDYTTRTASYSLEKGQGLYILPSIKLIPYTDEKIEDFFINPDSVTTNWDDIQAKSGILYHSDTIILTSAGHLLTREGQTVIYNNRELSTLTICKGGNFSSEIFDNLTRREVTGDELSN